MSMKFSHRLSSILSYGAMSLLPNLIMPVAFAIGVLGLNERLQKLMRCRKEEKDVYQV